MLGSLEADCWPDRSLRPTVPASGRRLTEPRNLRRKRRDATSTRWNRRGPTVDFGPSTDRSAMKLCHTAPSPPRITPRAPNAARPPRFRCALRFSRVEPRYCRGSPLSGHHETPRAVSCCRRRGSTLNRATLLYRDNVSEHEIRICRHIYWSICNARISLMNNSCVTYHIK